MRLILAHSMAGKSTAAAKHGYVDCDDRSFRRDRDWKEASLAMMRARRGYEVLLAHGDEDLLIAASALEIPVGLVAIDPDLLKHRIDREMYAITSGRVPVESDGAKSIMFRGYAARANRTWIQALAVWHELPVFLTIEQAVQHSATFKYAKTEGR